MRVADHLGNPREAIGDQKGAAADCDQNHIAGLGLHPVDRILDHRPGAVEHRGGQGGRHFGERLVADVGDAGGDGAVGGGDRTAAEHQRRLGQAVADAVRSDSQRVGRNDTAAAESERKQIGHAEQRAHLADLDDRVGLARKTAA